jgi:phosphatidylglycerophosphate synthase
MLDRYLRRIKDRWLAPVARTIGPAVDPAVLTWTAFAAGLGSGVATFIGAMWLGLLLWMVNRTLDGLDGVHARMHGRESRFGAYLDIVLDFVVYATIPIAIAMRDGGEMANAGLLLVGSFYVNAASWMYLATLVGRQDEIGRAEAAPIPPALVGGTETVAFYVAFFLWPAHQKSLFYAMAALVMANVVVRLLWARRRL